jgi:hypothetical protein
VADYKAKLEQGMRRLAAAQRRDYENRRRGESTYVSDLNVNDLAQVIAELLREQKADLLGHMNRLFQLSMSKSTAGDRAEDVRAKNLHARLTHLESVVRSMQKGSSR